MSFLFGVKWHLLSFAGNVVVVVTRAGGSRCMISGIFDFMYLSVYVSAL